MQPRTFNHATTTNDGIKTQSNVYRCDFMTSGEIAALEKSAISQEIRILNYLKQNRQTRNADASERNQTDIYGAFGASQIWQAVKKDREEVNAFRRALTNLQARGIIQQLRQTVKSFYGKSERLWMLNDTDNAANDGKDLIKQ